MIELKDKSGNLRFATEINQGSQRKCTLMKEDYITLKFSVSEPLSFKLGDGVDNEIGLFELVDLPKAVLNDSNEGYDYELRLDAYYWKWKNKTLMYVSEKTVDGKLAYTRRESSWNLTATLKAHLDVFIKNLAALGYTYRGEAFKAEVDPLVVENAAKLIQYDNTNLIDGLTRLAEAWKCEWWVVGNQIFFGRCEQGEPVDFELNTNVASMARNDGQDKHATRIYVFGSSRNLPAHYREADESIVVSGAVQRRLMLPVGTPYLDTCAGEMNTEEIIEDVIVFDEVYPHRVGVLSGVHTHEYTDRIEEEGKDPVFKKWDAYRFQDSGLTFSQSYILPGQELHLVFQSGALNGMDFVVSFNPCDKAGNEAVQPEKDQDGTWNPLAQVFEVLRNESYGRALPSDTLVPKDGDTYVLYGFNTTFVSDKLVADAEENLKWKALEYIKQSKVDPSTYDCKMMPRYVYNEGKLRKWEIGSKVNLMNTAYFENGRLSRIIGYAYSLDMPYDHPVYTIGESPAYSHLGELESKIESLTYKGQSYVGQEGVYLIAYNDNTPPTDGNAYSARRALKQFLRKDQPDRTNQLMELLGGLVVKHGVESDSVVVKSALPARQLQTTISQALVEEGDSDQEVMSMGLVEEAATGGNGNEVSVYDQNTPPAITPALWVHTTAGTLSAGPPILMALLARLDEAVSKINELEYKLNYKLDAGVVADATPAHYQSGIGQNPETEEDESYGEVPPSGAEPVVPRIAAAKRCTLQEVKSYSPTDGEFLLVTDADKPYLYVGLNGQCHLVGTTTTDPENPENPDITKPMDYIDLVVEGASTIYRVKMNANGTLNVYDRRVDTETCPSVKPEEKGAECLKGLTISMVYAGGENTDEYSYQPCSHSFIELHNNTLTMQDINLNGMSLQYSKDNGANWTVHKLKGIIPYGYCFLVRCAPCSDVKANTTVVQVDTYDLDIPDLRISNTKFKLMLTIGTAKCLSDNPMTKGIESVVFTDGYVDLVGAQAPGVATGNNIDGFEDFPYKRLSPNRGMVRNFLSEFNKTDPKKQLVGGDTNNNLADFRPVDFTRNMDVENTAKVYRPWTTQRGAKTVYYNKTDFNAGKPNMVTMTFGKNVNTTRCFNWISVGYYDEFLEYREQGAGDWKRIESIYVSKITEANLHVAVHNRKRMRSENGTRFTVHKCILNSLQAVAGTPKTYEYRVGRDGCWSEVFRFTLKRFDVDTPYSFLQVTDQQGWTWEEYQAWKLSADKIMADKQTTNGGDYDFIINTGDMTQNGNRANEWVDYFNAAKDYLPNYPVMACIGNNDLGPEEGAMKGKTNPSLFSAFFCHEYDPDNIPFLPVAGAWDMTDQKLIDKYLMRSVYSFDVGNTHFIAMNGYCYLEEKGDMDTQEAWFRADVAKATANPNIKWKVVLTHDCPFSVVTNAEQKRTCRLNRDDAAGFPVDATYAPERKYRWSRIFEELGIDLVTGGHKHTYARSKPVKEKVVNNLVVPNDPLIDTTASANGYTDLTNPNGIVYVTCQATGFKCSSNKENPGDESVNPWCAKYFPVINNKVNPGQYFPTFINWKVAPAHVKMDTYQVAGTMTLDAKTQLYSLYDMYDAPDASEVKLQKIDTMTLNKL